MMMNIVVSVLREDRPRVEILVHPDKSVSVTTSNRPRGSGELVMEFAKREQHQD